MRRKIAAIAKDKECIYLALIVVFGVALSLSLMKGVSFYGDDVSYTAFVPSILNGTFSENINIFSLRLTMLFPLAFSIAVFGYTDLGAGAWALFAYAITIMITYLIGRELHGSRTGLIAALLFAIYPVSLRFNTSPDPMLPLVMFLSLSVLLFIYGKRKRNVWYFLASGASGFVGALANPLAYLYFVFYAFYIVADGLYSSLKARGIALDYMSLAVFVGFMTAVAVMGYANMALAHGKPFYELNLTNSYYSAAGGPDEIFYTNPSLSFYINGYFPYGLMAGILSPLVHLDFGAAAQGLSSLAQSLFSFNSINLNDVGFFGYAAALSGIALLALNDKKSRFLLVWGAFLVAYMEFGSMSITHYFPIYKLMRFTAIVAVPLMLIVGAALSDFIGERIGKGPAGSNGRVLRIAAAALIIFLLFATSYQIDRFFYLYNHNSMQYMKAVADEVKAAAGTSNATLLAPALMPFYVDYYMGYPQNVYANEYDNGAYGGLFIPTCAGIPDNTYLVIPSQDALQTINSYNLWSINETWAFDPSECNFTLVADNYGNGTLSSLQPIDPTYTGNVYYKP